jgi:hypothetical protein
VLPINIYSLGTAYTFIAPDEEKYAPDIVHAMEASGAPLPEGLKKLHDGTYLLSLLVLQIGSINCYRPLK